MEYTADIAIRTAQRLTERALSDVAAIGGVSVGVSGGRRVETTLTVDAEDAPAAARSAIDTVTAVTPGEVVCVEVMTTAEQDRRLAERPPRLVGVSEVAGMLGVSRQRVSAMSKRDDFPVPVATLAAGPVWRAGDLSTFKDGWHRRPGRRPANIGDSDHSGVNTRVR